MFSLDHHRATGLDGEISHLRDTGRISLVFLTTQFFLDERDIVFRLSWKNNYQPAANPGLVSCNNSLTFVQMDAHIWRKS